MKKNLPARSIMLAALFICLFMGNCKKPERIIKVVTLDVLSQDITYDTIIIKGEIIDIGDGFLSNHGILLKESGQTGDNFSTDLSLGSSGAEGLFSVRFASPLPGTEYEYKAYAGNSSGTVYGRTKTFTSRALTLPELTTVTVSEITTGAAQSGGNITSDGGSVITARGICWSTAENPTTEDSKTDDPNPGTGEFVNHLAWLTANTEYYVRAYASNTVGTAYGNQVAFTTLAITPPVLTTAPVTEITNTTATSGGDITSDGGSEITARGICWSTLENPTINDEISVNSIPGTGEYTNQLSALIPGTLYYVRAYASNVAGTSYGNQVAFKSLEEQLNYFTAGAGLTDIDGNIYSSVIIGGQEWMAENLKTGTYKDGKDISNGLSNAEWQADASGAYSLYPYTGVSDISTDVDMRDAYGLLYNWYAVDNPSGLCPDGWRMPAHSDWNQLVDYLIGNYDKIDAANTGIYLKSCRQPGSPLGGDCDTYAQPYWEPDNIYYGTDNFGFAALPGGYRSIEGDFYDLGGYAYWWSSTEDQGSYAFAHTMACDAGEVNVASDDKEYGYSVRCIKEAPSQNLATLTTTAVTNITVSTATSGGNITGDGGSEITARGVVWATAEDPTTETNTSFTNDGTGTGNFTSEITGLDPTTTYYVRAYATNSVGTAYSQQESFTTSWQTDTDTEVVEVTNPSTGKTWMDRNLGASQVATSSTDAAAYGDLYQWGRAADGHQLRTSGTTSTQSNSDTPGHGDFILAPNDPYDWRSPQNDNLWQGVSGTNNPCPDGYRLPTKAELDAERQSWSSNDAAGAFGSQLKLPVAGGRDGSIDTLGYVGSYGGYWSSTVDGANLWYLIFYSSNADMYSDRRVDGYSVRCIKD